eukprot:365205-Chlamydomonas_euryale.AAC.4
MAHTADVGSRMVCTAEAENARQICMQFESHCSLCAPSATASQGTASSCEVHTAKVKRQTVNVELSAEPNNQPARRGLSACLARPKTAWTS